MLALFLKEISTEGSVNVQLVEGAVDLGEFIGDVGWVKGFRGLKGGTLVLRGSKVEEIRGIE